MATGTVVIDPGHGGAKKVGFSSPNNATSPSGVLEKNVTLRMGFLLREALAKGAAAGNHQVKIVMTRESDINIGLRERANLAKTHGADIFLSIHCNGFNQQTRGVETLVSPQAINPNFPADRAFAERIQRAVFGAIQAHDPQTKDRKVKPQALAVLRDAELGKNTRACLVELEFIDVTAVDMLLNIGPDAPQVRADIAKAIAGAILDELTQP